MEREKKRVKEKLEREKKKDEVAQEKAAEKLRQFQIREAKKAAERAEKEKKAEERKRLQDEKRRYKLAHCNPICSSLMLEHHHIFTLFSIWPAMHTEASFCTPHLRTTCGKCSCAVVAHTVGRCCLGPSEH